MATKVIVLAGQTIPDIAMQQSGSVEAMFALAVNNGLSITDNLPVGSSLTYGATPYDSTVAKIFQDGNYKPASNDSSPAGGGGIGSETIGTDFNVT